MASQETLTHWMIANQHALDLRVVECGWIKSIMPGWHDLDVSIRISGQKFTGRGSSRDEDTALCKAFCEAVERFVCSSNGIRSHGVAGHYLQEEAKLYARNEFIERFALRRQTESGGKLTPLPVDPKTESHYGAEGVRLFGYKINSCPGTNVVLFLADGIEYKNPFGAILGLGSNNDLEVAHEKASIECLRNLEAHLLNPMTPMSYDKFRELKEPNGSQRQSLLLNREYYKTLMSHFTNPSPSIPEPNGIFRKLNVDNSALNGCPLHFFRFSTDPECDLEIEFVG